MTIEIIKRVYSNKDGDYVDNLFVEISGKWVDNSSKCHSTEGSRVVKG